MDYASYAEASWLILIPTVLLFGISHGFDLDHLAAVDAMTRATGHNKSLSRWVGVLFSLGHGAVVILISLIIGGCLTQFKTPDWLDGVGKWISVTFLLLFGALNLANIFRKQKSANTSLSIRSWLSKKLLQKNNLLS